MKERQCMNCSRTLPSYHLGGLCAVCQAKALEKYAETSPLHLDIGDIAEILGLVNVEQARRLSRAGKIPGRVPLVRRHLFYTHIIREWIINHQVIPKVPTSPLQEEAKRRCENKDHDWLYDERFEGIAYASEIDGYNESGHVVSGYRRTCYFCGESKFVSSMYNY